MSVYGGFSTKKQSSNYFALLNNIVQLLQDMVVDSLSKNVVNYSAFRDRFLDNYSRVKKLESRKYMEPKYSATLAPLFQLCYDHQFFVTNVKPNREPQTIEVNNDSRNEILDRVVKPEPDQEIESSLIPSANRPGESKFDTARRSYKAGPSQHTIISTTNEANSFTLQRLRPNTSVIGSKRRNCSMSIEVRSSDKHPKHSILVSGNSKRDFYKQFQAMYVLPPKPTQFQHKLNRVRQRTMIKYSIDQLF